MDTLVNSVENDCDFDQQRDIDYATTLMKHWDDYGRYLAHEDSDSIKTILSMYTEALKNVYKEDPVIIRSVVFEKKRDSLEYPKGYGKLSTKKLYHFQDIITGFETYLKLLKDETTRNEYLRAFQGAVCNGDFMQQYFGVKFNPESAPEEFKECPK